MKETYEVKYEIKTVIKRERIEDLLCSAFEGGSNYWAKVESKVKPSVKYEYLHEYPTRGGSIIFKDIYADDDGIFEVPLNQESIEKGLAVMQKKYTDHFINFLNENDDAETGDVFLQCCLFGALVYG